MKSIGISLILASALLMISLVVLPGSSEAESPEATVKIECSGAYWGSISGDETIYIEEMGNTEYQVSGEIIFVIMTKASEDSNELKVSILVDGSERISKSTTEPMGEVRLSYSLGGEGDPFDDDVNEEESSDEETGFLCVSTFMLSVILVLASALIFAWIKKVKV